MIIEWSKIVVANRGIAFNEHFLHLAQWFYKSSAAEVSESIYIHVYVGRLCFDLCRLVVCGKVLNAKYLCN